MGTAAASSDGLPQCRPCAAAYRFAAFCPLAFPAASKLGGISLKIVGHRRRSFSDGEEHNTTKIVAGMEPAQRISAAHLPTVYARVSHERLSRRSCSAIKQSTCLE